MAVLATNMSRQVESIRMATKTRHPPPSPELMRQIMATNIARQDKARMDTRARHPPPNQELMRQIMATKAAFIPTVLHTAPADTTPTNNSSMAHLTTKANNMEATTTKRTNQTNTKGGPNRRDRNRATTRNQVISATIKATSTRTPTASKKPRR